MGLTDKDLHEAIEVLGDVAGWTHSEARWEQIGRRIEVIRMAWDSADWDAFRAATIELELLAPPRITPIGGKPELSAPEKIRERANRLVHDLTKNSKPGSGPNDRTRDR